MTEPRLYIRIQDSRGILFDYEPATAAQIASAGFVPKERAEKAESALSDMRAVIKPPLKPDAEKARAEIARLTQERDDYRAAAEAETRRCDELLAERNRARNETLAAREERDEYMRKWEGLNSAAADLVAEAVGPYDPPGTAVSLLPEPKAGEQGEPHIQTSPFPQVAQASAELHDRQWRPTDADTAFAPPFGTIRQCRVCGCLVAGGPTACARCRKGLTDGKPWRGGNPVSTDTKPAADPDRT